MKAMIIKAFGGMEVFVEAELPTPEPGANELLVRIEATSVNPVDYQARRGDYQDMVALPAMLGGDVSGVVEKIGDEVEEFAVGDEVYYMPQPQNLLEGWDKNATLHFVFATQYGAKLDRLRELIERGQIRPVIDSVLPLTEVAKAHERLQQGGVRGKIVLEPGD